MAKKPDYLPTKDLTTLTEFRLLTPDKPPEQNGFSLSRLLRRIKSDVSSLSSNENVATESDPESCKDHTNKEVENDKIGNDVKKSLVKDENQVCNPSILDPQIGFSQREVPYTRTLNNVLKRLRNILDGRSSTPQAYKDSDFKQYWMPDSNCKECYDCCVKFNTFRRRHHCRVCGQIFCRRCCNQEIPGKIMGYTGDLRACTYCCKVVLSYIQSSDLLPSGDFKALQDDLSSCLNDMDSQLEANNSIYESSNQSIKHSGSFRRKISTGFREEEFVRTSSRSDMRTFPSVTDMQSISERKLLTKDSTQLHDLWTEMIHPLYGLDFQNHRHLLKTFHDCVNGSEIVEWLLSNDKVASRYQAIAIGQALLEAGFIEVLGQVENIFLDDVAFYRAHTKRKSCHKKGIADLCDAEQEPSWVKEIVPDEEISEESDIAEDIGDNSELNQNDEFDTIPRSYSTFYLNLNLQESTASLKRNQIPKELKMNDQKQVCAVKSSDCFISEQLQYLLLQSDPSSTSISDDFLKDALFSRKKDNNSTKSYIAPPGWSGRQILREENEEKLAFGRLQESYESHRQSLTFQLLSNERVSLFWSETILKIVTNVVEIVRPDIINDNDDKDIRQYVHIKSVSGGQKSECQIISGVVSTKNILHRKMKSYIENPNILLISSAIVYQRVENKLTALEPIIMQEQEYLKNAVNKICSYKPDIILVEKTVSRAAQDMLLDSGFTVMINVKKSVLERVARCTQADIVSSLDAQIGVPHLGTCHRFGIHNYTISDGCVKTLTSFDGCAKHLGCTILLRGASESELAKVKKILQFLIYVEYNWKLERSFLMDEFAIPIATSKETSLVLTTSDIGGSSDNLFAEEYLRTDEINKIKPPSFVKQSCNPGKQSEKKFKRNESHDETMKANDVLKISTRLSLEEHIDPLRSSKVESRSKTRKVSKMEVAPLPLANRFRKALNDVVLSCSPNLKFPVPFLESETGRTSELRKFFPDELYWSSQIHKDLSSSQPYSETSNLNSRSSENSMKKLPDNVEIMPTHPFIDATLIEPISDVSVQDLLANFRACGGQIKHLCPHEVAKKKRERKAKKDDLNSSYLNAGLTAPTSGSSIHWDSRNDALDPFKHQRLPVLFCSYSYTSSNAPNFCVNPWVVNMDFYGKNDITLGDFLERYCFRDSYECPSETCDTPMGDHIRKFVHGDGCIHIVLKQLNKNIPMAERVILMWSWCCKCRQVTPFAPMSIDTWSLSFAKYLDLRFNGQVYTRRASPNPCGHVLHHDFYQYFAFKDTVASFKYSKITLLEVVIPSIIIKLKDQVAEPSTIINEVKNLTIKGYSIYSCILEKLCTLRETCSGSPSVAKIQNLLSDLSVERNDLREHIGEIQMKLTSPSADACMSSEPELDTNSDSTDVWCEINDLTCYLKQIISNAVVVWNNRLQEFIALKRREDKASKRQALISVSSQGSISNIEGSTPNPSPDILHSSPYSSSLNSSHEIIEDVNLSKDKSSQHVIKNQDSKALTLSLNKDKESVSESETIRIDNVKRFDDSTEKPSSVPLNEETPDPILATSSPKLSHRVVDSTIDSIEATSNSHDSYVADKERGFSFPSNFLYDEVKEKVSTKQLTSEDSKVKMRKTGMIHSPFFFPSEQASNDVDDVQNSELKEQVVLSDSTNNSSSDMLDSSDGALQGKHVEYPISEHSDTDTQLAETNEECRKTIEALERLEEEGYRKRVVSLDKNVGNSTHSSISSVIICETAGMISQTMDSSMDESFAVIHSKQVKELENETFKETSKEGRSHERSKSDGDKLVSSQQPINLSFGTNENISSKIPQSSTTPVIKVSTTQSNDKERKVGGTMKNLISQFLSSPLASPVQSPFSFTEHFILFESNNPKPSIYVNIPIIVYDEEPSSVIAYTLASKDYENALQELVDNLISAQQRDVPESSPRTSRRSVSHEDSVKHELSSTHNGHSPLKKSYSKFHDRNRDFRTLSRISHSDLDNPYYTSKRDSADFDEDHFNEAKSGLNSSQEMDRNTSKIPNHHIEVQFSDSSANFYCKVYFAEQFRMLRKLIFPFGEERYIRSLSRCRQWKAHGGKSGSIFCKTYDDRFILKQMSRFEVQSYVGSAAQYFKYVHRAASEKRPTVLAKILGVYYIVYKNTQTNTSSKLHLLVMENLFYGRKITRKFDLKGSERNRLVNTAGKEESELVLLDENLLKMTCDCPLYIKPHTKAILTTAIDNDSAFLSSLLVMDYSLLVGLDEEKKELVVGIIDYIRTFTWDKKIEMVVKVIGNQGKMPTVISPESYRSRFCDAMDRYFIMVPDRWNDFDDGVIF